MPPSQGMMAMNLNALFVTALAARTASVSVNRYSYSIVSIVSRLYDLGVSMTSLAKRLKLSVSAITQSVEQGERLMKEKSYHFP